MVKNNRKKVVVATHNGKFHADEVFAVATLNIFFGQTIKVLRTRDVKVIEKADIVVDVGMKYDQKKYFDHHQLSVAGKRKNGIPFASFGLVWKHFGPEVCRSAKISLDIDRRLVQTIDAEDNGVAPAESNFDFLPYGISSVISSFNLNWDEDGSKQNFNFAKAVKFAEELLRREIMRSSSVEIAKNKFKKIYENSKDKGVVVLNKNYPWREFIGDFTRVKFVVYPGEDGRWHASSVRKNDLTFENKKTFPQIWAGKTGADLERASGVVGAVFCHKNLFFVVANSRDSVIRLVQKALKSKR